METLTVHPVPVIGRPVRIRPGRRTALRQALQIQQRVFEASVKDGVKPSDLAQLARAWDVLEDRKRVLRGRPLPGSLKPLQVKPKRRSFSVMPIPRHPEDDSEPMAEESQPNG